MKYCTHCGHRVEQKIPDGDNRLRFVCDYCQRVHYSNPRIVAGCLAVWQDRVLLCRRAIEPGIGLWTLPAGFMENRETLEEAAVRETVEEACIQVKQPKLYTLFNIPHINQVTIIFRAELPNTAFAPGAESLEVELFAEDAIPWNTLAFSTTAEVLHLFFTDRRQQQFPVRNLDHHPREITD